MQFFGVWVAIVCAIALWSSCSASNADSNVLTLTPETFDATLSEYSELLVVYVAPWCGHCKTLQTTLSRAVTRLRYKKTKAAIGTLDAAAFSKFAERRGITGYPTLHYYKAGVMINEYLGERSDRAIAEYANRMAASGELVTRLSSIRDLLNFCSARDRGDNGPPEADADPAEDDGDAEDADMRNLFEAEGAAQGAGRVEAAADGDALTLVLGLFPKRSASRQHAAPVAEGTEGSRPLTDWERSMPPEEELIARGRRGKMTPVPVHNAAGAAEGEGSESNGSSAFTPQRSKAEEAYLAVAAQYTAARFAITDNEFLLSHFDVHEDSVIAFGEGISVTAQVIGRVVLRPPASSPTASAYMPPGLSAAERAERAEAARDSARLRLLADMKERVLGFLVTHAMPPITPFGPSTMGLIDSSLVKVHLLLFLDAESEHSALMVEGLSAVAQKHRGR